MSLQLRLFGGGKSAASSELAQNDGHAIDKSKVLAATAPGVITPNNPGNFGSIRTIPVVPEPRYFSREEKDAVKELKKEKVEGAQITVQTYKALAQIEEADAKVHKAHRKYQGAVAENELKKVRSNAGLAKKLHGLRPGYARLGMGIDKADSDARTRIDAIRAKLTGGSN
jgi:hypothetical protein